MNIKTLVLATLLFEISFSSNLEWGAFKEIKANGKTINLIEDDAFDMYDVGYPSPTFADWDGDGINDLLVGQCNKGRIRFYKNIGSNEEPKFEDFTYLESDSGEINVFFGWCIGASSPQVEDFNGDGIRDLIVGSRNGSLYYFSGKPDGTLHKEGYLIANGEIIWGVANSAPAVVDWNEDGLLDLVLGMYGDDFTKTGVPIRIYLNVGTKTHYKFSDYKTIKCDGKEIIHFRAMPAVVDLNNDGKKDLIVGNTDNIFGGIGYTLYYYLNVGTNNSPQFKTQGIVKSAGKELWFKQPMSVSVTDWNNDNKKDLLVGVLASELLWQSDPYLYVMLQEGETSIKNIKMKNIINADYKAVKILFNSSSNLISFHVNTQNKSIVRSGINAKIYTINGKCLGKYSLNFNEKNMSKIVLSNEIIGANNELIVHVRNNFLNFAKKILIQ